MLAVLTPIWNDKPETASRLRGRIEAVLASAQVDGWIPEDRPNPARWKNWLDRKLPQPKKLGSRGHHKAMAHEQLPAFMARIAEIDSAPSKALQITVLTCARTSETLGMTWDEIDFENAIWTIPASRMKMGREHQVPLSDQAIAILRRQHDERGTNPHVFPGRPMRGLIEHGARDADEAIEDRRHRAWISRQCEVMDGRSRASQFEVAEAALGSHGGQAVVAAYQRSSMLELRRPVLQRWADFICPADNVVELRRAGA